MGCITVHCPIERTTHSINLKSICKAKYAHLGDDDGERPPDIHAQLQAMQGGRSALCQDTPSCARPQAERSRVRIICCARCLPHQRLFSFNTLSSHASSVPCSACSSPPANMKLRARLACREVVKKRRPAQVLQSQGFVAYRAAQEALTGGWHR